MYLYFKNSNGQYKLLSNKIKGDINKIVTEKVDDEIYRIIRAFIKNHNYKSYYTRVWQTENNDVYFDVGSWTEFFVVSEKEYDIIEDLCKEYSKTKKTKKSE